MLVAVTGATGTQGSSVVAGLAARGYDIRALVRDNLQPKAQALRAKYPDRIVLVTATLEDPSSLIKAFKCADAIYAYTPDGPNELDYGKNIADAAAAVNAPLLIWSTCENVESVTEGKIKGCNMMDHKEMVDRYIEKLGINHVFIRCGGFYENYLKYDLIKYDKESDQINIVTSGYPHDLISEGVCITYDLDNVVHLVLSNPSRFEPGSSDNPSVYFPKTEKENDYVHLSSGRISFGRLGDILRKITGKKVNITVTEPLYPEWRLIVDYIEGYGGWTKDAPEVDPKLTSLGFKPTRFEDYTTWEILPALGL